MNDIYGIIATMLVLAGSGHYLWQIVQRKVKPHFFSCLVWATVTSIVAAGLIAEHAGPAGWRTVILAALLVVGTLLSLRNGFGYVRRSDLFVLLLALLAIPIWVATKSPDASILWILFVEIAGALPAFRKAWQLPYEEGIFGVSLNAASNIFAFLALSHGAIAAEIYFIVWGGILAALALTAAYRRTALSANVGVIS